LIYAPFISTFPVALGLKMLVTAALLTTLCFALLLPLTARYPGKLTLGILSFTGFLIAFFVAHLTASFTPDRAKPTSLVYLLNTDERNAQWATYERNVSGWTHDVMGADINEAGTSNIKIPGSKYNSRYTYTGRAEIKDIPGPVVTIEKDTTLGDTRFLKVGIFPQRDVNRLEVFTNGTPIKQALINGVELSPYYLRERKNNRLFTHYISDNDSTLLELSIPRGKELNLTLYEASNDLLEHPMFDIPPRPDEHIPMPFVLNDAVITIKSIRH
jgi:energy-coupling factor transporter transmembrane protein EcfT